MRAEEITAAREMFGAGDWSAYSDDERGTTALALCDALEAERTTHAETKRVLRELLQRSQPLLASSKWDADVALLTHGRL